MRRTHQYETFEVFFSCKVTSHQAINIIVKDDEKGTSDIYVNMLLLQEAVHYCGTQTLP